MTPHEGDSVLAPDRSRSIPDAPDLAVTPPAVSPEAAPPRSCCDESYAVETSVGKVPCPTHFMEYIRNLAAPAEAAPPRATTRTYLSGIDGGRLFTQADMDAVDARHAEAMERGARAIEAYVLRQRAAEQDAAYLATLLASVRRDVATALNGNAPRDALEDIARLLDDELAIARPVSTSIRRNTSPTASRSTRRSAG